MNYWQHKKSVTESMDYMRINNICCDVKFLVGTERILFRAHKIILIARSPVFYSMLEGPLAETDTISVPDIEKDTFELFLKYLYTDKVTIDENVAESLLYAAEKYMIDDLFNFCINYYMKTNTTENACIVMDQACLYDIPRLKKQCLRYICDNAEDCLASDSFRDLSHQTLDIIIACEDLCLEEEKVYKAVVRWSDYECLRREMELSDENRRQVIGNVLYNIHFPIISKEFFDEEISKNGILSTEEKLLLQECPIVSEKDKECKNMMFKGSDRRFRPLEYEKALRLQSPFTNDWCPFGSTEAIIFKVSHPVWLHGILLYGKFKTEDDNMCASINIDIRDQDDDSFICTNSCNIIENNNGLNDVLLHRPVRIQSEEYKVVVTLQGPFVSWGGKKGKSSFKFHECEINFQNCENPKTNTNIDEGQIPGLLLSRL